MEGSRRDVFRGKNGLQATGSMIERLDKLEDMLKAHHWIAEEQEVQEGVGPEEVDEGAAQTPACCRENGEAGEEQQDRA